MQRPRTCAKRRVQRSVAAALQRPREGLGRPPRWCRGAPVPRSPAGASTPPTNDPRRMGRPVHSPSARSSVRFVIRRDAAHRGLSGRRPRTFERTSIPTAVGRGRSRTRVTNRATMSDRPRAGTRPAGLIARRYQKRRSPPGTAGGDRFDICEGTAGDRRRSHWRRLRGPGPCLPCARSRALYARRRGSRAIGKAPHPAASVLGAGIPRTGPAILRAFPSHVEAARTGEVLRSRDQGASSVP